MVFRKISLRLAVVALVPLSHCFAGGGPENVFVVVNKNDLDSKTIANHFTKLRMIPSCNVFELDWRGDDQRTNVDVFRKQILEPIFRQIDRRRLSKQIDYIVFSSGFPYGVVCTKDFKSPPDKYTGHQGSITGLTYLSQLVRTKNTKYADYLDPPNHYASYSETPDSTRGFSSRYGWTRTARRTPKLGSQYYLSMMLGHTEKTRGNTVAEIVHYLRRSAMADGTNPPGTIYFMENGDRRSQQRKSAFPAAVKQLNAMGIRAEINRGVLPDRKTDVSGALIGFANFEWATSGSTIMPGAIVEHLTSFGGSLKPSAGQTPLTHLLRYGAAGASGTVMEPYNMQQKFPHPTIHCHYARGCTLAEAFYQSVQSPYQLLIVGDPLCRPWARIPVVTIDGLKSGQTISGKISIQPRVASHARARRFRLFVDGRLRTECAPGGKLEVDTTQWAAGFHEIRVVAIEDSNIESQGRIIVPCFVEKDPSKITCVPSTTNVRFDEPFRLSLNAPGAKEIGVYHRRIPLAKVTSNRGEVIIDPSELGTGPIELTVVAKTGSGVANAWFAKPVALNIIPDPKVGKPPLSSGQTGRFNPQDKL